MRPPWPTHLLGHQGVQVCPFLVRYLSRQAPSATQSIPRRPLMRLPARRHQGAGLGAELTARWVERFTSTAIPDVFSEPFWRAGTHLPLQTRLVWCFGCFARSGGGSLTAP